MRLVLALLFAVATLPAEEARVLDPAKPEQAIAIVVQLTQNMQMSAHDAWVLKAAIDTLNAIVQERAKAAESRSATGAAVK